jgi:hypothetical protein
MNIFRNFSNITDCGLHVIYSHFFHFLVGSGISNLKYFAVFCTGYAPCIMDIFVSLRGSLADAVKDII